VRGVSPDGLELDSFRPWPKGRAYEDFAVGQVFEHHWGRTITEADNVLFSTATLTYNPLYLNVDFARAHDHRGLVVNPMLVFTTVLGLTVEDLSEGGGPFLGVDELTFHRPVYVGDTLTARSEVVAARESESRPGTGIVTWHTEGFNQDEAQVIDYRRSNLLYQRRGAA
jgi:itaconyl-CoA hydratase